MGTSSRADRRQDSAAARSPHVVWFYCDQLRADALGFMGNGIVRTPHLDRLARMGIVFENVFTQCPVCMGSRGAMIEMADAGVGRVLDAVERAGELHNTIFAFVADHGELLGHCGLWRKGSFHYDCMIRIPCILAAPGRLAGGRRVGGLAQAIDLAPTILALAHLPPCPAMQGRDLSGPLAAGENDGHDGHEWTYTEMYTALWGPSVACWTVRTRTAKLNFYPEDRVGHLFDLSADPDERVDLWGSQSHRGLRDAMMANLVEELSRQADPLPRVLSQY